MKNDVIGTDVWTIHNCELTPDMRRVILDEVSSLYVDWMLRRDALAEDSDEPVVDDGEPFSIYSDFLLDDTGQRGPWFCLGKESYHDRFVERLHHFLETEWAEKLESDDLPVEPTEVVDVAYSRVVQWLETLTGEDLEQWSERSGE